MLPLQHVAAQQSADSTPPVSSTRADEQIASLLRQVETLLDEGHFTSPTGGNASEVFTRALVLSSSASPAGLRTIAEFPSALKSRADAERAAGHVELSVQIEDFAEVLSSVIGSHDTLPRADASQSAQFGVAKVPTGIPDPAARKAATAAASQTTPGPGAADQAIPVSGETPQNEVGRSSSKAITDKGSPQQARSLLTKSIAQHVSPPVGPTGPLVSSGRRQNAETAKASRSGQVATLSPGAARSAESRDGIVAIPEPDKVPPSSAAMVDALLKQGKAMLSIGDISAARLLFTRAAQSGNGEAALALGDTYNSVFLAEHGVAGPQADLELAKRWYRQAFAFGEPRARERLATLGDDRQAEAQGSVNTQ